MSNVEIILNQAGVRELLCSDEMASICSSLAAGVAASAGNGYVAAAPHMTGQRVAVNVYAESLEARQDNLDNNTLLKCI